MLKRFCLTSLKRYKIEQIFKTTGQTQHSKQQFIVHFLHD